MSEHRRVSRGVFLGAAAVGVVVVAAIPAALGVLSARDTYALSEFKIVYPYDDPREHVPPSQTEASVTFTATWPSSGFPGEAQCRLTLTGSTGLQVGTLEFDLTNATDGSTTPPLIVPVEGEPVAAAGSCSGGTSEEAAAGEGYILTGPTEVSPVTDPLGEPRVPNRTRLQFDVRWATTANPGMHTCYLRVSRADGTRDAPIKYNVLWGEEPVTFDVEGKPEDVEAASVSCGPFEG